MNMKIILQAILDQKILILLSSEMYGGNKCYSEKSTKIVSFLAIFAIFRPLVVEISEVLPVEISTNFPGIFSTFTGKKIKSIGPTLHFLIQVLYPPSVTQGFGCKCVTANFL